MDNRLCQLKQSVKDEHLFLDYNNEYVDNKHQDALCICQKDHSSRCIH